MTTPFTSISPEQAELNQELRTYAERMPVIIVQPTLEEAIVAIEPHFPELTKQVTEVQSLLDEVGLPVITDIGKTYMPMRISWSIASTKTEANHDLQRYSQASFNDIRTHLGIDYHWIFLVHPHNLDLWVDEDLIDASCNFSEDGEPKCWILDGFS